MIRAAEVISMDSAKYNFDNLTDERYPLVLSTINWSQMHPRTMIIFEKRDRAAVASSRELAGNSQVLFLSEER